MLHVLWLEYWSSLQQKSTYVPGMRTWEITHPSDITRSTVQQQYIASPAGAGGRNLYEPKPWEHALLLVDHAEYTASAKK